MTQDTEDVVAGLRESAAVFRANPVYNSDGDGAYLKFNADLDDKAADLIQSLSDRIDVLEDLLAEYGDRVRMARAEPAAKQWAIDEAMSNVAARAALHQEGI